jgi:hypothetical protein
MPKRCLECGYDNSDLAEVCVGCGSPLIEVATPKPRPAPVVVDIPPGSGAVRSPVDFLRIRGPPRAKISFGLCLVATILVTLNAVLRGLAGDAIPIPVSVIPLVFVNVATDVLGVILGFSMLVGTILIIRRREVSGSAMMIVLSLLSLVMGGGFAIGFLLGLLGAFLGLLKK